MVQIVITEDGPNSRVGFAEIDSRGTLESDSFLDQTPTIFLSGKPIYAIEYFQGHWLPCSYTNELTSYAFEFKRPLDLLEIERRRENLAKNLTLVSENPREPLLLDSDYRYQEVQRLLGGLVLQGKARSLYNKWTINRNGKSRELNVPKKPLEKLLRGPVKDIIMQAPCHRQAHGGEKGWSVKQSLASHLPIGSVLSFDLASAFMSTTLQYAFDFYYSFLKDRIKDPNELKDAAGFLSSISTVYYKDGMGCALPMGSPISNPLFNRILYPIDEILDRQAKKRGMVYTRWVDDLIVSSRETKINPGKVFGAIRALREDFTVRMDKTFFQQAQEDYYLLGHRIKDRTITKIKPEEMKNRGQPVSKQVFATALELEHDTCCDSVPDFYP